MSDPLPYNPELTKAAQRLRKNETPAEKILWENILRRKQLLGYKFTRQKPMKHFILDFYCSELLLGIEVDGKIHDKQKERDADRTAILDDLEIKIIRYKNEEILKNLEKVRKDLEKKIEIDIKPALLRVGGEEKPLSPTINKSRKGLIQITQYILNNAATEPDKVRSILIEMHERGETVQEILEFVKELNKRKIAIPIKPALLRVGDEEMPSSPTTNKSRKGLLKIFDVCGTGGSGLKRINLSTALAIQLSKKFTIAKHGNKAASGSVGSFDVIDQMGFEISDTPENTVENLCKKNLAFIYAPAFHPALKDLAPIRKSISHPTIFNYLGPLLNPVKNITAQLVGVSDPEIGEKLAKVALELKKNILFVHDMACGLDDVSICGQTVFWKVKDGTLEIGSFTPEQLELPRIKNFKEIEGGDTPVAAEKIIKKLLDGTAPTAHKNFLEINKRVAENFFSQF